jgi:hypothetical protein
VFTLWVVLETLRLPMAFSNASIVGQWLRVRSCTKRCASDKLKPGTLAYNTLALAVFTFTGVALGSKLT